VSRGPKPRKGFPKIKGTLDKQRGVIVFWGGNNPFAESGKKKKKGAQIQLGRKPHKKNATQKINLGPPIRKVKEEKLEKHLKTQVFRVKLA